jgi:F-type H+-transporting ATPase subunit epsilon
MRLRITTPLSIVIDEDAVEIVSGEDASGGFGIQPHHADFLTTLSVGVVSWCSRGGARHYCAVHGGVLRVIGGKNVAVTTREAIPGDDLATLDQAIIDRFGADADAERSDRMHNTKLELRAIREMVRHLRPGAGSEA